MRPYPHGPGQYGDMNDYEEELAAYKRKRDWEKERDRRKTRKKQQTSSSDSSSDSDESSSHKKKRSSKHKHKKTTKKHKDKLKEKGRKTDDESEGQCHVNYWHHDEKVPPFSTFPYNYSSTSMFVSHFVKTKLYLYSALL